MEHDRPTKNYFEIPDTLEERVEQGALLLDKVKPQWVTYIEDRIIMQDCKHCVLGQVFGLFSGGIEYITDVCDFEVSAFMIEGAVAYGFDIEDSKSDLDYIKLERVWWTEINKRKGEQTDV